MLKKKIVLKLYLTFLKQLFSSSFIFYYYTHFLWIMHILSRKGYALKSYLHIHLVICHQEKSHLVSRLATDTYLIKIGNRTNTVDFIVMYLVYRITFSVLGSIEVIYRVEFTQTCSRKCLCFGRETSLWPKTDIFWCRGD